MSDGITQNLDGLVHHLDGIQIDDDGSLVLPKSVNVRSATFTTQARATGGHDGKTHNKFVNFFSCMDE